MQYQVHVFRLDGACIGILPALHGTRFVAGEPKRVRARNCNIYYAYVYYSEDYTPETLCIHTYCSIIILIRGNSGLGVL